MQTKDNTPDNLDLVQKTDSADKMLLVGYPKSGNTWLGYMLTHMMEAKYIALKAPNRPPTKDEAVLKKIGWDDSISRNPIKQYVCKSHAPYSEEFEAFGKIVLIIRDPRDVIVSFYHFIYHIHKDINWFYRKLGFKKTLYLVLKKWGSHTSSWAEKENVFVVKYEELNKNTLVTLQKIVNFLEVDVNDKKLQETIDEFSFDKMSKGRARGQENKDSFFRKGIIGDHKNQFDIIDKSIFKLFGNKFLKKYNY